MPSLAYDSFFQDMAKGNIDTDVDTFKVLLVTSAYTPSQSAHAKRSDVTNEVAGTGYTAGGTAMTVTPSLSGSNRMDLTLGSVNWPTSTITARGAVVYKSRGGAASADELVCYLDFGADITSTAATFTLTPTGPIRIQN